MTLDSLKDSHRELDGAEQVLLVTDRGLRRVN